MSHPSDEGCSPEWRAELTRRATIMSIKLSGGEESRREVLLMQQAGVVLRRLRICQGLSREVLANRLGLDPDFIIFLENGLVGRDELSSLRQPLASMLDIGLDTLNVLLDGRLERTAPMHAAQPMPAR